MRSRFLFISCALLGFSLAACSRDATAPAAAPSHPSSAPRATLSGLNVTIAGPGSITNWWECTWYAWVSGGTPPYTYQWSATGMTPTGPNDADYWTGYKAVSSYGGLDVYVSDATGKTGSAHIIIEDSGTIPNCNT
jgi:hypothetical protein